tara:strand:+ start:6848 stop:7150 length:303 start_codon:yes stop_codon:yes gene_type:complete
MKPFKAYIYSFDNDPNDPNDPNDQEIVYWDNNGLTIYKEVRGDRYRFEYDELKGHIVFWGEVGMEIYATTDNRVPWSTKIIGKPYKQIKAMFDMTGIKHI